MEETRSRGIYLVANHISSEHCHNLIYTIRQCGCRLPIRIIPYGGKPLALKERFEDVELVRTEDFPVEGREFAAELERRLPCSPGLLRRFLCWFGEFDDFLYSDNDIVALMNWEEMFSYLGEYELVHADHEYRAGGIYNLRQPERFAELLGCRGAGTGDHGRPLPVPPVAAAGGRSAGWGELDGSPSRGAEVA